MDLVSQNLLMTSGGKKDPTYVEDVFSTYLYKGNDSTNRVIENKIKLGNANAGNSVKFSGSSGELEVASTSDLAFGTDPFTIEFWLYFISVTDYCAMFEGRPHNGNGAYQTFGFAGGQLSSYSNSANTTSGSSATAPAVGQWTHIALVREGTGTNQEKIYFNGTQVAQGTNATNIGNQRCLIAGHAWSRGNFNGQISNYRVTKGQALYTSNFTPSTQALTTTSQGATASNVKLLCCQSSSSTTAALVTPGTIDSRATSGTGGMPPASSLFGPFTTDDGEGGLVWTKVRTASTYHVLQDSDATTSAKFLQSQSSDALISSSTTLKSFTNSGYTLGSDAAVNNSAHEYSSWTFRKQKGFFDIVTYTGNDANRTIAHSLGCVPGLILIKGLDAGHHWQVYHRDVGNTKVLKLNDTDPASTSGTAWNNTSPTSTHFSLGTEGGLNSNGQDFVAYLFAGGASTDATAKSVEFDGNDNLDVPSSTDFDFGSGDFTVEAWVKTTASGERCIVNRSNAHAGSDSAFIMYVMSNGKPYFGITENTGWDYFVEGQSIIRNGAWNHVAATREGNYLKMYVNGILEDTTSWSGSIPTSSRVVNIGVQDVGIHMDGEISNVRIVKGTAVYTSSFRQLTKPLTNVTNTKLLCCNNSSVTGSTVTTGTITANGNPTASTDSPFDDLAAYKFGEEGDQNLIKCGSYTGNGTNVGVEVQLGFEPQFLIVKNATSSNSWFMFDSMRGITTGYNDFELYADSNSNENSVGRLSLTPTGFRLKDNEAGGLNTSDTHVYIAFRRSDGYVGKPSEVATNVFDMLPSPPAGYPWYRPTEFPVDFSFSRDVTAAHNWDTGARIIQGRRLQADHSGAETSGTYNYYDYQDGWNPYTGSIAGHQAWMWKRCTGFDVVTDKGDGQTTKTIAHGLGVVPEMIWRKNRVNGVDNWQVYHIGLNGGTNPQLWRIYLDTNNSQSNDAFTWTNAPTATHFTVGGNGSVNRNTDEFVTMLFASVEGISKCGYYNGSNSGQTITTGFQPTFVIIKRTDDSGEWYVLDTKRGWVSGNDKVIKLDNNQSQFDYDMGAPTSTGFTLTNHDDWNNAGKTYIYYAHA